MRTRTSLPRPCVANQNQLSMRTRTSLPEPEPVFHPNQIHVAPCVKRPLYRPQLPQIHTFAGRLFGSPHLGCTRYPARGLNLPYAVTAVPGSVEKARSLRPTNSGRDTRSPTGPCWMVSPGRCSDALCRRPTSSRNSSVASTRQFAERQPRRHLPIIDDLFMKFHLLIGRPKPAAANHCAKFSYDAASGASLGGSAAPGCM